MKLSEIISLNPNFKPYYDLKNEDSIYWSSYISNNQFEELLDLILKSLYSQQKKDRLSTWFYGTYGTGKSHAIGVIKKLITSSWDEVAIYVESHIKEPRLVQEIEKRASIKEVFPVVLKGVSLINDAKSFKLAIENAVKEQLSKMNITLSTQSEFEKYIQKTQDEKIIDWTSLIENSNVLFNERNIKSKNDLIRALRNSDSTVLNELNQTLINNDIQIANIEIVDWLKEIQQELSKKGIAQKIVIFWDEFTSIMDLHNDEILQQIQDIAELTPDNGIHLVIVSHKTHNADNDDEREKYKRVLGRFNQHFFAMHENTTYDLIAGSILKQDYELWLKLFNRNKDNIKNVVSKISKKNMDITSAMNKMFPLHPYTAYVANYVSRQIGSTERSIFKFLYDENIGFLSFINECDDEEQLFCTADKIFDFFIADFENDKLEYVRSVVYKFKHNSTTFKKDFLPIFKGLLLLNITHRLLNAGDEAYTLLIPNQECLHLMFEGTIYNDSISVFLKEVDEKGIINRDYDGRYIIDSGVIGITELDMKGTRSGYQKFPDLLGMNGKENLASTWKSVSLRRSSVTEIDFIDDSESEPYIISKINKIKNKSKGFSMNILAFGTVMYSSNRSIDNIIQKWDEGNKGKDYKNIVFVSIQNSLTTESEFDKFIINKAKETKAKTKSLVEEVQRYKRNSEDLLSSWVDAIKDSPVYWYLFDNAGRLHKGNISFKYFHQDLEEKISSTINHKSFDVLSKSLSVNTIWNQSTPKAIMLHYLQAENLNNLTDNLKSSIYKHTLDILRNVNGEQIVRNDLKLIADIDHPLCEAIKKLKLKLVPGKVINLKDELEDFFKPPFSYYGNHVFFAVFGYIFRDYRKKLIDLRKGKEIDDYMLQEVLVSVFKVYSENKSYNNNDFEFTIGSPIEKEFCLFVGKLFGLEEVNNVQDLKLKLMSWFKEKHPYPLWLYEYDDDFNDELFEPINEIIEIIDRNYQADPLKNKEIQKYLQSFKNNEIKIKKLFLDSDENKVKQYFEKYFTSLVPEKYTHEKYDSLFEHVRKSSQGDIYRLTKVNADSAVYEWFARKHQIEPPIITKIPTPEGIGISKDPKEGKSNPDIVNIARTKIKEYKGDFKSIMIELLEKKPEICEAILSLIKDRE